MSVAVGSQAIKAHRIRRIWTGPLSQAIRSDARFLNLEGAVRSGKTTGCLWKILESCLTHPGIHWWIARWTDDDTRTLLRPRWREIVTEAHAAVTWRPEEHAYQFGNGALVYAHGIRPSDELARYAKLRGKTVAGIYVDQAEELPEDIYDELAGRISQTGYPQQLVISPNAVPESHWIARRFPDPPGRRGDWEYIRVSVADNETNLEPGFVASLERLYPVGHPKRRMMIDGLRGLNVIGQPVYAGAFERARHLAAVECDPHTPLLEAIDFGKHRPCVVWAQLTPLGGLSVLGGLMGEDIFLEQFAPALLRYRADWFPQILDVQTCCDPAGAAANSQGTSLTGVSVLREHRIFPRWVDASNVPTVRRGCIEAIAALLQRHTPQGPAFQCHPDRWIVLRGTGHVRRRPFVPDALEAGYVWDERARTSANKAIVVPVKDGEYEHGMNCLEYVMLNFGPARLAAKPTARAQARAEQLALRQAQRDWDPADLVSGPQGRGGYH